MYIEWKNIPEFEKRGGDHEIIRKVYKYKLTDGHIKEIRESDLRQVDLGIRYNVSQTHISAIKLNKVRKGI